MNLGRGLFDGGKRANYSVYSVLDFVQVYFPCGVVINGQSAFPT